MQDADRKVGATATIAVARQQAISLAREGIGAADVGRRRHLIPLLKLDMGWSAALE